jgi:single-stranded DNA-binding protein
MAYDNVFSFTGRLGSDPILKYTKGGKAIVDFTVAIAQGKDKPPAWISCKAWEDIALEIADKYSKGSTIRVRQSYPGGETWTDNTGKTRNKLFFTVTDLGEVEPRLPRDDDDVPY